LQQQHSENGKVKIKNQLKSLKTLERIKDIKSQVRERRGHLTKDLSLRLHKANLLKDAMQAESSKQI
jgi:Tfp pilus assembly protein PilO